MTTYYDAKNTETQYTQEMMLAILTYQLKPYPESWYATERQIIAKRNDNFKDEYEDLTSAYKSGDIDDDDLMNDDDIIDSQIHCPINKWQYLICHR